MDKGISMVERREGHFPQVLSKEYTIPRAARLSIRPTTTSDVSLLDDFRRDLSWRNVYIFKLRVADIPQKPASELEDCLGDERLSRGLAILLQPKAGYLNLDLGKCWRIWEPLAIQPPSSDIAIRKCNNIEFSRFARCTLASACVNSSSPRASVLPLDTHTTSWGIPHTFSVGRRSTYTVHIIRSLFEAALSNMAPIKLN